MRKDFRFILPNFTYDDRFEYNIIDDDDSHLDIISYEDNICNSNIDKHNASLNISVDNLNSTF